MLYWLCIGDTGGLIKVILIRLYKGLIGLNMSLYSSKDMCVGYIPYRVYM